MSFFIQIYFVEFFLFFWYLCYYPYTSRVLVSSVCGIFLGSIWSHVYSLNYLGADKLTKLFTCVHYSACCVLCLAHCTKHYIMQCAFNLLASTIHCMKQPPVKCTLHCTPYTLHCTPYTVHRTLYTIHCTLYTVHCTYTVHRNQCTVFSCQHSPVIGF